MMSVIHVGGLCFAPMFWVPTIFVADKLGIRVDEAMQRDLGIAIWNILWTVCLLPDTSRLLLLLFKFLPLSRSSTLLATL